MKTTLTFLMVFITFALSATETDTIKLKSRAKKVTVFMEGAQIYRSLNANFTKGKHVIVIEDLPIDLNAQSIQVQAMKNTIIHSVKHNLDYPSETNKSVKELELEQEIEKLKNAIKELQNRYDVFAIEEKILMDNRILAKKNEGSNVSDIKEAAEYFRIRLNEIRSGMLNLSLEVKSINDKIKALYKDLNKLSAQRMKEYSTIYITLECEAPVKEELWFSYYIASAGWKPYYDFRVEDITQPLKIVYNANVYQSTGEPWQNIQISLSSGNPALTGTKPEQSTWYLGVPQKSKSVNVNIKGSGALRGVVKDASTEEPIPFANVIVEKNGKQVAGTTTDFDGIFQIKPIPAGVLSLKTTYVGYTTSYIDDLNIKPDETQYVECFLESNLEELDEVILSCYKTPLFDKTVAGGVVTADEIAKMPKRDKYSVASTVSGLNKSTNIRGSRSEGTVTYVDGVKKSTKVQTQNLISNSMKSNVANLVYDIEIPYNIPSDGENYSIKIKEIGLPVRYVYHAVPKIDQAVFLTAEISEWEELNLLSGQSNLYYQGTYVGESYLDSENTADTLNISLGRDNSILIKRNLNKNMHEKRFFGNNIKETIAWDIEIKNNKTAPINIEINDQFPLSNKNWIVVERLDNGGGKVNEKTGEIVWKSEVLTNENKTFSFKYSVKYPKNDDIGLTKN